MTKEMDDQKEIFLPREVIEKYDYIGKLGEYDYIEKLGEGGYGEIYKVEDKELGRVCALKILKFEKLLAEDDPLERDKIKRRFIQEAKLLAQCQHPNIAHIYKVGGENDRPYLIMEYIEGISLENLIKEKGRLPFKEILEISGQILDALRHIHQRGLVLRDLTPRNILIANENDRIVIIDFGIVKALSASDFTGPQEVIGNPYYMSPEQWRKSKEVEKKTDIYSFGVILYQMLTGEVPFDGTTEEILYQHLYEPVPDVMNKNLDAPRGIQKILRKAMDKRPEYRYPDAMALLDALKMVDNEDEENLLSAVAEKLDDRYIFEGEREKGGLFSNVYRMRHRVYDGDYLLKIMDFDFILQTIRKAYRTNEDIEEAFNKRKERFIQKILFFRKLEHHPNIVTINDSGFIPIIHEKKRYDVPYLVVKKIIGPLLKELIEKNAPLEFEKIFKIAEDILSALLEIHKNGYICWEVVPEKIIIEENSGKAILISAGLADDQDIYSEAMVSETKVLIDMRIVDVLKYSLKEADQKKRGIAADIRQFGMVLYQMLTGDTNYDRKFLEIFEDKRDVAILYKMEKNPGIPEAIAKRLAKIIKKTIKSGYDNVEKIKDDLERVNRAYSSILKKK